MIDFIIAFILGLFIGIYSQSVRIHVSCKKTNKASILWFSPLICQDAGKAPIFDER